MREGIYLTTHIGVEGIFEVKDNLYAQQNTRKFVFFHGV